VEYLVAARKIGPGGAGAGQPPCVTGGSGRRGRRAGAHPAADGLAGAAGRTRLTCWLGRAGRRGRRQAWRAGCLAALLGERRLLGTRAAAEVIPGSAAPRSVARQALPRQRSTIPVAATSALCRATMHGATQVFGRTRTIGAAKSVSFFKKIRQCAI